MGIAFDTKTKQYRKLGDLKYLGASEVYFAGLLKGKGGYAKVPAAIQNSVSPKYLKWHPSLGVTEMSSSEKQAVDSNQFQADKAAALAELKANTPTNTQAKLDAIKAAKTQLALALALAL